MLSANSSKYIFLCARLSVVSLQLLCLIAVFDFPPYLLIIVVFFCVRGPVIKNLGDIYFIHTSCVLSARAVDFRSSSQQSLSSSHPADPNNGKVHGGEVVGNKWNGKTENILPGERKRSWRRWRRRRRSPETELGAEKSQQLSKWVLFTPHWLLFCKLFYFLFFILDRSLLLLVFIQTQCGVLSVN